MSIVNSVFVTVLIVNWNGYRDTLACLSSLRQTIDVEATLNVVVLDNGSSDGSFELIREVLCTSGWLEIANHKVSAESARVKRVCRFDAIAGTVNSVVLVESKENYGFAAGNNIAHHIADELWQSQFFWLLNSDTQVAPDSISHLLLKMRLEPAVGICGCTILYADGTQRVQSYGGSWYSFKSGRGWSLGMDQNYDPTLSDREAESAINYVSGAAMLIRATTWQAVGPLCEDYFLYNEEIDLTMRLSREQLLGVATRAVVFHKVGGSIGSDKGLNAGSRLSNFFQARSKLIFAAKHTPKNWPWVWLTLLARAAKFLARPSTRGNAWVILAVLAGRRNADPAWFGERLRQDAAKPAISMGQPRT